MAFPVKWYASNMQGAPSLGDTSAGALAALLKAVLVTGFGTLTINSLVWDATEGAAKATISAGHAYLKDSVIEVSGASPAAYNGEHRVKKVSSTEVWFELDGGDPGSVASGTMSMKVAPLGWTLTHESGDGMVAIYRPTDVSASGNVSLRIDNTAFTNWTHTTTNAYLAKVAMVEDVVDINNYTTIYEHRWPATQRYATKVWDFIGDSQLFYWVPTIANTSYACVLCFGYLKTVRPGDRYHAVLTVQPLSEANVPSVGRWDIANSMSPNSVYTYFPLYDSSAQRVIARAYGQLFGTSTWWLKGLFGRMGTGLNVPNAADNAFYISADPLMVLETGNTVRGYLPGVVVPYATIIGWDRRNFADLPAMSGRTLRFMRVTFDPSNYNGSDSRTMMGFDLTGPWR